MHYINHGSGQSDGQTPEHSQADIDRKPLNESRGRVLITGGAGFIGVNLADRLLRAGHRVIILDNLSRQGVEGNLRWLKDAHGDAVDVRIADVQQTSVVNACVTDATAIFDPGSRLSSRWAGRPVAAM